MLNRVKKKSSLLFMAIAVALIVPPAALLAHDDHATGIYKTRHDEYEKLGDAFKTLRDQTRAGSPDAAAIKNAAKVVNDASVNQFKWFPAGSGPQTGAKTRAKAEIWSKPKEFETAQKLFAQQATKLSAAAGADDIAAVRAQFGEVGKTCKNCHETFRTPDE